jgi:hypothetical protein
VAKTSPRKKTRCAEDAQKRQPKYDVFFLLINEVQNFVMRELIPKKQASANPGYDGPMILDTKNLGKSANIDPRKKPLAKMSGTKYRILGSFHANLKVSLMPGVWGAASRPASSALLTCWIFGMRRKMQAPKTQKTVSTRNKYVFPVLLLPRSNKMTVLNTFPVKPLN